MSKPVKRAVAMPTVAEDRVITAAAKADPDAQPLTPKRLKAMVPIRALRGRPPSENKKQLVSIRYSPEFLAYFKSTGEGRIVFSNALFSSPWPPEHGTRRI